MTLFGTLDVPDCLLNRSHAVDLLQAYLEQDDAGRYCYSGAAFDCYAPQQSAPNKITNDDLVALAMLGIRVTGHEALWLTRYHSEQITKLLTVIPLGSRIEAATSRELLAPGQAAWKLWFLLCDIRDHTKSKRLGPVAAGKLLACKRPNLIPIGDKRTARVFNRPNPGTDAKWWEAVRTAAQDPAPLADGQSLWDYLTSMRETVEGHRLPVLRVLDILAWMHLEKFKTARCSTAHDPYIGGHAN